MSATSVDASTSLLGTGYDSESVHEATAALRDLATAWPIGACICITPVDLSRWICDELWSSSWCQRADTFWRYAWRVMYCAHECDPRSLHARMHTHTHT